MEFFGGPCDGEEAPPDAEDLEEDSVMFVPELHRSLLFGGEPPPMRRHKYRRQGDLLNYEGVVSGF